MTPYLPAALAASWLLLLPASAAAYELKETSRGEPVRWWLDRVELRVDPSAQRAFGSDFRRALEIAVEAWRGLGNAPEVVIAEGPPDERGYGGGAAGRSNGVYVLDEWPFDPSQLAVTVTTYEEGSGRLLDADIFVNAAKPFGLLDEGSPEREDRYDLAAVLAHEIGHVLGLGETLDSDIATMWPRIGRGETHQRTIEEDDELGVIAAYLHFDRSPPSATCGATLSRQPSPAWLELVAVSTLAIVTSRRSRRRLVTIVAR